MPFPILSLLFPSLSMFLLCLPNPLPFLLFSFFLCLYLFIDTLPSASMILPSGILSSFLTLLAFLSCPSFPYCISFLLGGGTETSGFVFSRSVYIVFSVFFTSSTLCPWWSTVSTRLCVLVWRGVAHWSH